MSHIYEAKITALEGECERLRAANAQLTKERDELEAELFNEVEQLRESYNKSMANLEARVKRYREALEWYASGDSWFRTTKIEQFRLVDLSDLEDERSGGKRAREALAEPKTDSEGA